MTSRSLRGMGVWSLCLSLGGLTLVPTTALAEGAREDERLAASSARPAASTQDPSDDGGGATEGGETEGGTSGGGSAYGGRSTGPAALITLPSDPNYPVPGPPESPPLPEEVDEVLSWQPNAVCDPVDKPGLEAFANLIGEHYDRPGHTTSRTCIEQKSEHYDGRAVDWQLDANDPQDRRIGDAAVTWLTAHDGEMAKRFGIQSLIWNSRSWRPNGEGWQAYVGQSAHADHVHVSFTWDGAMMRTSWWTGVAVTDPDQGPCPVVVGAYAAIPQGPRTEPCTGETIAEPSSGYADVRPGEAGAGVDLLQPLLGVPQTGELDPPTREALISWQSEKGIPQTGVLDQLTYLAAEGGDLPQVPEDALAVPVPEHLTTSYTPYARSVLAEGATGPAVELLQEALDIEADGQFGAKTAAAVREFTAEHPLLTEREQAGALLWHLLQARDYPTLPYRGEVLEIGAQGPAVAVLQAQLDIEADGEFGEQTAAAVAQAQEDAGLEPTGVVDGPTWAATDGGVPGPSTTPRADTAEKAARDDDQNEQVAGTEHGDVDPWTVDD